MAIDTVAKRIAFVSAVKANAAMFKIARDTAAVLRERISSDAQIAAIADGDSSFAGDNLNMSRTIIDNYLTGVTLDMEKCLTNQVVATSNRLPNFLAIQG